MSFLGNAVAVGGDHIDLQPDRITAVVSLDSIPEVFLATIGALAVHRHGHTRHPEHIHLARDIPLRVLVDRVDAVDGFSQVVSAGVTARFCLGAIPDVVETVIELLASHGVPSLQCLLPRVTWPRSSYW